MSETTDQFPGFSEAMLAEAAPLAYGWSHDLCRHSTPSGESCAGSHGLWQYLRLFGISNPITNDAQFFRDALGAAIRRGARRVLIAGCADYAMAAVVQWVFAREGAPLDLTVLDVCETPLRLNRWYAERTGTIFPTVTADILAYEADRPFDIICSHSILGLFAPPARGALVARWHALLVPGGVFATAHRVAPNAPDVERFSAAQAKDFRERLLREGAARQDRLRFGISLDELSALVDSYIAQNEVYSVRSETELAELIESGGFRIERLQLRGRPGANRLSGPTMSGGGSSVAQLSAMRV